MRMETEETTIATLANEAGVTREDAWKMYDDTWTQPYNLGLGGAGEAVLKGMPPETREAKAAAVVMNRIAQVGVAKKAIYKGMVMKSDEAASFGIGDVVFGPTAWSEKKSIAEGVFDGPGLDEEGTVGVLVTLRNGKSLPAGADVLAERVTAGSFTVMNRAVDEDGFVKLVIQPADDGQFTIGVGERRSDPQEDGT